MFYVCANTFDDIITAEIPNKDENAELHSILTNMLHRPGGLLNPNSPCITLHHHFTYYISYYINNFVVGVVKLIFQN